MTRPRWTPESVEKYEALKGNYNLISRFFEGRTPNSICKRYLKLLNLAQENNKSTDEFVDSRRFFSNVDKIQEILEHETRNDRIFRKIIKNSYSVTDVIIAILQLAKDNNLLKLKLVFVLKYLMIEWTDMVVDEIYKISMKIRNELFLQLCCCRAPSNKS